MENAAKKQRNRKSRECKVTERQNDQHEALQNNNDDDEGEEDAMH